VRSRFAVLSVGLVGVLVGACTRSNPAFGGEGTDGGKDDDATDPSAEDDEGDDDDDSADDEGSEVETSNVDDGADTGVVDEAPSTDMGPVSTSGGVCEVFPPVRFDVKAMDGIGAVEAVCGGAQAWHGAVLTAMENELTIEVCADNTCECGADVDVVTLTFEDLAPSPVDAIANLPEACVAVMVTRHAEADGCTVAFIVVEQIDVQADFPLYLATSSAAPDWGLAVPVAQRGEALEVCEGQDCDGVPAGEYSMVLGELGPLAPGESGQLLMNPYAGPQATYEVTDLFSRIDGACEEALGWAGLVVR
jgi:hypothetical protein